VHAPAARLLVPDGASFVAPTHGICTVSVTLCSSSCANPATANYRLRITRNGSDTQVGLTRDDR
jgi:hypothetical protein